MKNVVDVALFFFTIPLFLVVIGSSMIFYYFILTYKELTWLFLYIEMVCYKKKQKYKKILQQFQNTFIFCYSSF